mmetsp:Transcript_27426/g.48504  ORF Transcript_27426/g.48504 Transcript_27426/m.48504 type:complete len:106 (-) Transcript_27426:129-446(-)
MDDTVSDSFCLAALMGHNLPSEAVRPSSAEHETIPRRRRTRGRDVLCVCVRPPLVDVFGIRELRARDGDESRDLGPGKLHMIELDKHININATKPAPTPTLLPFP